MRPEHFPLFNRPFPASMHFDDAEARLRCLLHQDAAPTFEGGRHMLFVCPVCKHPWYKAGRREYPRLTHEQLTFLGATLHADTQSVNQLPHVLCPICSTMYLDGISTIEEYRPRHSLQQRGYHFLWERASAPYTALVAMLSLPANLPLKTLVQMDADTLTAPVQSVAAVLAWLEQCTCPPVARLYTDEEGSLLARRLSPASPISNRHPHVWCGYAWQATCLPLNAPVLVSVAGSVADPLEPVACAHLLHAWRVLARALRMVL